MTVGPFESRVSPISAHCSAGSARSAMATGQDHHCRDQERPSNPTSPPPCPHLSHFRARNGGAKPFRALQDCIRVNPPGGRASIRRDKAEVPRCRECGGSARPRLYACVTCAAVSCHSPLPSKSSSHVAAHAQSTSHGHEIAVDVDRAELFCCVCRDQIYDRDFDAAVVLAQMSSMKTSTAATSTATQNSLSPENIRKRRRVVDYRPWSPALQERVLMENSSISLYNGAGGPSEFPAGLRGLNNLGNTCFMNSVLQALLHTPPLRNYFLSDQHNQNLCQQKNAVRSGPVRGRKKAGRGRAGGGGDGGGQDGGKMCLACDLDAMFSVVFSGDRRPYSPAKFLYSWWQHAANLASYEQQDAHEFFISILDRIHEKQDKDQQKLQNTGCWFRYILSPMSSQVRSDLGLTTTSTCRSYNVICFTSDPIGALAEDVGEASVNFELCRTAENHMVLNPLLGGGNGECCIAHKVFSGILRSDVMCMTCGFTSTTYDPCVDISLDLEPNQSFASSKTFSARLRGPHNSIDSPDSDSKTSKTQNYATSTLVGCLDHFTRAEKLGPDQKFFCQQCQENQESLKQMSIRKLPLVSCFHIKRFEHSPVRRMSRKVDRYLQFPFSLDMTPYLSSSVLRSRFGNRMFLFNEENIDSPTHEVSSEFELFAVVTHSGKLESGHYVTYLRLSNEWYKCDDAWITRVNENIVRASQGYMIFYVQKTLSYKTSDKKVPDAAG